MRQSKASTVLSMLQSTAKMHYAEYVQAMQIIADPTKDGMKCGSGSGSANRVFDLRSSSATEQSCKAECSGNPLCTAFSGVFNNWCIGCKVPLNVPHAGAVSYKKATPSQAATTTTTTAPGSDFALGEIGSVNGCPLGFSGIFDEETCRTTAKELQYMLPGTMHDSTTYPGCMFYAHSKYSGVAYFNTHPSPNGTRWTEHAGQICKADAMTATTTTTAMTTTTTTVKDRNPTDIVEGAYGVDACPAGYTQITYTAECEAAATALGHKYEASANANVGTANSVCNWCGGCNPATIRVDNLHGWKAKWICKVKDRNPTSTTTTTTATGSDFAFGEIGSVKSGLVTPK